MRITIAVLFVFVAGVVARPVPVPTVTELAASAQLVVIIRPLSTRGTTDKPDDDSFGARNMSSYQALETTCRVETVLKGEHKTETIKIVHFAYASRKPEFNGGVFMTFLFDPVQMVTFPATKDGKPDMTMPLAYANGSPEYLAFLRRLPDGRYTTATRQYDAGLAFRVLTTPFQAQQYHYPESVKDTK